MTTKPLLDFIARYESAGDYDIVWGGIKAAHRPPKPLTTMTIGEVLAWQDSIDRHYMSEAAGRYQILEDTLRGIYASAGLSLSDKVSRRNQDRLAEEVLRRRVLDDYLAGRIDAEKFCNSLAKEWASLPVVTGKNKGRSYYAGDGLNKAHAPVDGFLRAVLECRAPSDAPPADFLRAPTDDHPKEPNPISGAAAVLVGVGVFLFFFG